MPNDAAPTEYGFTLPAELAEKLEHIARFRSELDGSVTGGDIIQEALSDYLARSERESSVGKDGKPKRPTELFQCLFAGNADVAFKLLSEGIIAMLDNAEGLIEDATLLADAQRYDRADFLAATATEEMGKAYILLDMCRVDLARHQHILRHLCSSFYSHVLKHVYFDLSANDYAGIWELPQVQHYFRIQAKEWWPGDLESGEPDMPHDTFFLRDANLYVDINTYDGEWSGPSKASRALKFEDAVFRSPIGKVRENLCHFRAAQDAGLLQPEALRLFNNVMKRLLVSENTSVDQLLATYSAAGADIQSKLGISQEIFRGSVLHNWPLYWVRR